MSNEFQNVANNRPQADTRHRNAAIYIGNFLDESIIKERGLPSPNVAGSNRMIRLSNALAAANFRPIILSPAASLRMGHLNGLFNWGRVRRVGPVAIIYTASLNPGYLNAPFAPFIVLSTIRRLQRRRQTKSIMIYNFSVSFLLAAIYLRLFSGGTIINNIEDVSLPRWRDWLPNTEVRPLQQMVLFICMKAIAALSHAFIVPTKRFLKYLPRNKPTFVAPGCIDIPAKEHRASSLSEKKLRVLFGGKIEFEHGIDQFVAALRLIDCEGAHLFESIDITGGGVKSAWLKEELSSFEHLPIKYHGFVGSDRYRDLLERADVCIALQRPNGRYGDLKTPSKVIEYLGFGKAVISTDVGDLSSLPRTTIRLCSSSSPSELAEELGRFAARPDLARAMGRSAQQYSRDHFSFGVVGSRLKRLFDELAQSDSVGRRNG